MADRPRIQGSALRAVLARIRGMSVRVLMAAVIGVALVAPAYAQTSPSSTAPAQGETTEIRAAVLVAPPFIMEQNGSLTGFTIELWNAIAAQLKLKTNYQMVPDLASLEEAMRSQKADVVVAPVFITSARDEVFDFSIPTMEAGLQIMVRESGETTGTTNPLWAILRLLFSWTTILWLGMALVLVLIPAHGVWLIERRREDGIIKSRNYFPGIFEAINWALSTLTTQAEAMPRQWAARAFSIFWMFAGVVFVALYTAQLTTTLTVEQIRGDIEGPADLPGKRVATIANSTAVQYLREHQAQVQEFRTPDDVFKALLDKKVDAIVSVAPALQYYAAHDLKGRVKMVGPEFETGQQAFMVPLNSPLRKRIDGALLILRENGTYQTIHDKWFGAP